MGNSCEKSGSVEISAPPSASPTAVAQGNNNNNVLGKDSNNAQGEDNNNVCASPEKCSFYVRKALDEQHVTVDDVVDYSETLLEAPGEELVFNFDNVIINEDLMFDSDEPDSGRGPVRETAITVSDVGAAVDDDPGDEEIDISSRDTKWSRKRRHKFDYSIVDDKYMTIREETLDVRKSDKRKILALSDLHLGGSWSKGMDWKLRKYMDGIIEIAEKEVACLVLLGDVFEMWLEKFAEVPPSNEQRVEEWKKSATVLTAAVDKLVTDCGVKVFYIRGNHDYEVTEPDVAAIFNGQVTFIPCTLVLRIQTDDDSEHRVRFAHGHQWDVFNSYMLQQTNNLLPDRPIGYYIARAVATAGRGDSDSELEDILIGLASSLLTIIPSFLEDDLVDTLLDPDQHRRLIARLFEGAFKVKDIEFLLQAKCRISDGKWIRLQTLLEYPLLRLCGAVVGKQDVFHMIKASTGDYKKFIKRIDEDIVVLAHTHRWDLRRYRNYRGNSVVYANTGCWTNHCEEFSTVILSPPTEDKDGSVVIDYGKNEKSDD